MEWLWFVVILVVLAIVVGVLRLRADRARTERWKAAELNFPAAPPSSGARALPSLLRPAQVAPQPPTPPDRRFLPPREPPTRLQAPPVPLNARGPARPAPVTRTSFTSPAAAVDPSPSVDPLTTALLLSNSLSVGQTGCEPPPPAPEPAYSPSDTGSAHEPSHSWSSDYGGGGGGSDSGGAGGFD